MYQFFTFFCLDDILKENLYLSKYVKSNDQSHLGKSVEHCKNQHIFFLIYAFILQFRNIYTRKLFLPWTLPHLKPVLNFPLIYHPFTITLPGKIQVGILKIQILMLSFILVFLLNSNLWLMLQLFYLYKSLVKLKRHKKPFAQQDIK